MESFEYSKEFKDLIYHLHREKENLPYYQEYVEAHLGGPESRFIKFTKYLCPEMEYHLGPLKEKRILDFGSGTASTTAALCLHSDHVCGFDIDDDRVNISKQRMKEHGFEQKAQFFCAKDISRIKDTMGKFDIILINDVFEHIPLSIPGLREKIFKTLLDLLKSPGCIFLNKTPNRIYPVDIHTTHLWWLPYMKPGSEYAYKMAIRKGRHVDAPVNSQGPLGLEERGAWGATYWEIMKYCKGYDVVCLNTQKGHDRYIHYTQRHSKKRAIFETALYFTVVKLGGIPLTAFTPDLTNLMIEKR